MLNINYSRRKMICGICGAVVLWTLGARAAALPPDPDNAALLYYQAFLLRPEPDPAAEELVYNTRQEKIYKVLRGGKFEPDAETKELMHELKQRLNNRGAEPNEKTLETELVFPFEEMFYNDLLEPYEKVRDIDPNEKIREYLTECHDAIEVAQAASEMSKCDWGIQYSQGFSYHLPQLTEIRDFAFMLRADALLLAADGAYRAAFERCLMIRRFARHVGDDANLLYMISKSVDGNALECIQLLLGYMKPDVDTLTWLKNQLAIEKGSPLSPAKTLKMDFELAIQTLRMNAEILENTHLAMRKKDELKALVKDWLEQNARNPKEVQGLTDEELLALAAKPYANFLDSALRVMDSKMPYEEEFAELQSLTEDLEEEFGGDSVATLMMIAHPEKLLTLSIVMACADGVLGLYNLEVRHIAHFNALKAAIEIYLATAKTGQLPETLPDGLPKDPYSGQDFEYEITEDGFVLRCRVKDTDASKVQQYKFKVQR